MRKEKAVLAAGCFWGVEELVRAVPGVLNTEVGYCGGDPQATTYQQVKTGQTGHAEAVLVEFDSDKLGFADLLRLFFKLHDPTTVNRQGNDVGTQYRSAIFYQNENQKQLAIDVIQELTASKKFVNPIVTKLELLTEFISAEEYHQDYLQKNPNGYTCHFWRN